MADPFNFTNNSSSDPMSPNFTGAVKGKGRFSNPFTTDLTEATKAWQKETSGLPDNVIRPGLGAWNLGIVPEDLYRAAGLKGSVGTYAGQPNGRWNPTNEAGDDTADQFDARIKILENAGLDTTEARREAARGYDSLQSRNYQYVPSTIFSPRENGGTTVQNVDGTLMHLMADGSLDPSRATGSQQEMMNYQRHSGSLGDPSYQAGMQRGFVETAGNGEGRGVARRVGAQMSGMNGGSGTSVQSQWTPEMWGQQKQWQQQSGMQNPYMPQQNTAQTAQPYQYQQPNQFQKNSNAFKNNQQYGGLLGGQQSNPYAQQQTGLLGDTDQFKNKFAEPMGMSKKFRGV